MKDLRGERRLRNLSLEQVAESTSIPADILASLEAEPDAQLRPGSTIARWREQYVAFLQQRPAVLPEPVPTDNPPEPTETTTLITGASLRTPVGLARALGLGVAVAVLVLLGLRVASVLLERPPDGEPGEAVAVEPELVAHELNVRAIEPSRIVVEVDGEPRHDGVLPARQSLRFTAERELALFVPDLTRVKIRYNGEVLRPLGNLSAGRRLVFIDDEGR